MNQAQLAKLAEGLYNFQNRWKCKVGWYRKWEDTYPPTKRRWIERARKFAREFIE